MPEQFWKLTLTEFMDLIEGYKWRNEREWEKVAQLAVWTSQKLKKNMTAKKLLGTNYKKKKTTQVETREVLEGLTAEFGGTLGIDGGENNV
jgi:hypothetical protein